MSLQPSIDAVAKAVALADLSDLPALVALQDLLVRLAEEAADADLEPVSAVSAQAADLVERLVLREIEDSASALRTLANAVDFAQRAVQLDARGESIAELESPFRAAASASAGATTAAATDADADEPVAVDVDPESAATLAEFLVEAREHLANAEAAALELERTPHDAELVNTVFRAFHTIKGVAGFMQLAPIVELAHAAETLLDQARSGARTVDATVLDLVLTTSDMLGRLANALEGGAAPTRREFRAQLARLGEQNQLGQRSSADAPREAQPTTNQRASSDTAPAAQPAGDGESHPAEAPAQQRRTEQTVKVATSRMDALIDMVGELVIAQLMVQQDPAIARVSDQRLQRNLGHMAKIVRDLQEVAMSLRMVTMRSTFQRMTRLVRDVAARAGKHVQFVTHGEDTELDRNVVEAIADPLVHLIRNACDHGIECDADRVAAGKSVPGTITLRACHRGGMIVIEVSDDGRGLQREKILAKCKERGLVSPERATSDISDDEVFSYIFLPGFSTAERITDISGRGVGMDVVRRNIEALRGTIQIRSKPGEGSTFTLQLPLTLAIIDGMLVRVGSERFVIPTLAIERAFRPAAGDVHTVLGRGEMASVRGSLVPVRRLHRAFAVSGACEAASDGLLVLVESRGTRACLFVDEIIGQQQVVIKNLGSDSTRHRAVSGGAILGDGRVALILDVGELLQEAA
ncbi:MAG: chemotaxis protein CheA [Phycisphaerales bacterium]